MNFGLLTLFDYYPEDCSPQEYYRFLLDEIAYAEELGFDFGTFTHHRFSPDRAHISSPFVLMSAMATGLS